MSRSELLNNITHKDLRIITKKSAAYGDAVGGALIFPSEFSDVQKEYPIFFQKDNSTGEFQAVAIFGFNQNENLFLGDNCWQASYVPAIMEREPFLIGFQRADSDADATAVIHVDMDAVRISKSNEGEPVFLEQGGNTPFIDKISRQLLLIHEGVNHSKAMFSAFLALDVIEPFALEISFNNGAQYKSEAYYTLNQEKFFALDDAAIGHLHRSGYLHYAYMVLSSLGNIKKLIELRNRRDAN